MLEPPEKVLDLLEPLGMIFDVLDSPGMVLDGVIEGRVFCFICRLLGSLLIIVSNYGSLEMSLLF